MLNSIMRYFTLPLVLSFLFPANNSAVASSPQDAQTEYRALLALSRTQLPLSLRSGSDEAAKIAWFRQHKEQLHGRGAAFLERYAADSLRWDVLVLLRYGGEEREKISRSGSRRLVPVPESKAAWDKKYFRSLEVLLAAPDASASARGEALRQLIDQTARSALFAPAEAPQAIPRVRGWLDQYDREFPRSRNVVGLYHTYANLLDAAAPDLCVAFLAELEQRYQQRQNLDKQVQEEVVAGHRRALQAQALPMDELWARLRGLDAVVGDPARYRGKVVLVAFGPVTYDTFMEALEDLHSQYAMAGLVILQVVSFDPAYGLPPESEQRRNLERIVAIRKWPWAVLWNPRDHLEIVKKWGYNTIPARMLIGRDGRLISDRYSPFSVSIPRELARSASEER